MLYHDDIEWVDDANRVFEVATTSSVSLCIYRTKLFKKWIFVLQNKDTIEQHRIVFLLKAANETDQ